MSAATGVVSAHVSSFGAHILKSERRCGHECLMLLLELSCVFEKSLDPWISWRGLHLFLYVAKSFIPVVILMIHRIVVVNCFVWLHESACFSRLTCLVLRTCSLVARGVWWDRDWRWDCVIVLWLLPIVHWLGNIWRRHSDIFLVPTVVIIDVIFHETTADRDFIPVSFYLEALSN